MLFTVFSDRGATDGHIHESRDMCMVGYRTNDRFAIVGSMHYCVNIVIFVVLTIVEPPMAALTYWGTYIGTVLFPIT